MQTQGDQFLARSYGRVHFGLLEICESEPNCFGGIGLMVEQSIAIVRATLKRSSTSSCEVVADSHWQPRIEAIMNQWLSSRSEIPFELIEVVQAPLPHQGLGSGTQMACTISSLLLATEKENGEDHVTTDRVSSKMQRLTQLSQRGKRSNIGLCGFLQGGFVVDRGKNQSVRDGQTIQSGTQPRTQRFEFPNWPVILLQDTKTTGDSGDDEVALFEQCRHRPNPHRDSMIRLIHEQILPALHSLDWERWNAALGEYGRWAGAIFEPVQGGVYRTSKIASTIEIAGRMGLIGATQSSWGPTVCAFARDPEHANWCCDKLRAELIDVDVTLTKAANESGQVHRS